MFRDVPGYILKNMVGTGHIIDQWPYKGCKIRRVKKMYKLVK